MKRDSYWDSLKFMLVFGVVLAHCLRGYMFSGGINQPLVNFLYIILMPTFFFVSGMFSQMKDREKFKIKFLCILETYIVFQLIRAVPPMLISDKITLMSIAHFIVYPCFTLWYLLSLFYMRLMIYYLPEKFLRNHPKRIIFACFLISLLGGFIPVGHQFSIQRTMTYLPFFFMGYYSVNIEVKKYIAKIPSILAVGVCVAAFLLFYILLNRDLDFIVMGKSSYWFNTEFTPTDLCFSRFMFLVSAIIVGSMVMRLVMVKPLFVEWGKITLFIYIYHSFLIQAFRFALRHHYLPQNEWICFAMSVIITIMLLFLSKIKFLTILLTPVSYMKERITKK